MRWRLTVEYDGTRFVGWQLQPNGLSVQEVLEGAIARLFDSERLPVDCSGRTDAGVHAEGQVCAFTTDVERSEQSVLRGLNSLLPRDVAVLAAERAPDDFDPRRWAVCKTYRYRWLVRPGPSPLRRNRVWHRRAGLDVEAMQAAARFLVGTHDFSSFRARRCTAKHPVRTVDAIEVRRRDDEVELWVRGHGFLRHMVRIMAGTLALVGSGKHPPEWVEEVLQQANRHHEGPTAPARGLALVKVDYAEGMPLWWGGSAGAEYAWRMAPR